MDGRYRILLVDDEENNLSLMNRVLRERFEIEKTASPIEALEMIKTKEFEIIISDHKMPQMDGVEFLHQANKFLPNSIKLLVTAYSDASILINAINYSKIYRYIKKPWTPEELLMVVDAAIEYFELKQDNELLIGDLKELFSGTISAIIEALDAKDSFTLGRSRRVAFLAMKIAKEMRLPISEVGKVELAGLLHDIGMIGIPETILNKTEKLTEEEFEKIQEHVMQGVRILEDIKQLGGVVEIIKAHHERYDGGGYPKGLRGDEIPTTSQIIFVADTYDSMVSNRSYRAAATHKEALERIKQAAGKQFRTDVVDAFLKIADNVVKELKDFEAQLTK